jgi:hypothetical protein
MAWAAPRRPTIRGSPFTTAPEEREWSRTTTTAEGACASPSAVGITGRAAASAIAAIKAVRRSNNKRFRSRSRRLWRSSASTRYRIAGKTTVGGCRRWSRCSSAGRAAAASPTNASG